MNGFTNGTLQIHNNNDLEIEFTSLASKSIFITMRRSEVLRQNTFHKPQTARDKFHLYYSTSL